MLIHQIKKRATVQIASTQTQMKKNLRSLSRSRPRCRIWLMRIQSASADSAGQPTPARRTHYLVRANAQAPSVRFITNACRHGWRPVSSPSYRATLTHSSGKLLSVKSVNLRTLLWWKHKVKHTTWSNTKSHPAITWCLNHLVKRRTPLELSTLSDHQSTKRFSSLGVVMRVISESTIYQSLDAIQRSSLSVASSCLRTIKASSAL